MPLCIDFNANVDGADITANDLQINSLSSSQSITISYYKSDAILSIYLLS